MDLFETLGLGARQPEENELYIAIYSDSLKEQQKKWKQQQEQQQQEGISGCTADQGTTGQQRGPGGGSDGGHDGSGDDSNGEASPSSVDPLDALRARCTAWLLPYIHDYVWQRDPLVLRSSGREAPPWERRGARGGGGGGGGGGGEGHRRRGQQQQGGAGAGFAGGREEEEGEGCVWCAMRFGDAVDDEWWAVWLVLRMTRELQDLTAKVWDNDGEFLLIEAAYALPRWLKPETAANRLWLRRGQLHLLPLPSAAAPDLPASPTVGQALAVLREGRYSTASPRLQRPIEERLAGYPARARREQQHVARVLLPAALAGALRREPQGVAELVEAFVGRDAEDMRAASRMRHLPPALPRVTALVRMTRCHYAQLCSQRFAPPRGAPSPPPGSALAKAADLGLKLTAGAEILCARFGGRAGAKPQGQQQQPQEEQQGEQQEEQQGGGAGPAARAAVADEGAVAADGGLREADVATDPAWGRFKRSLQGSGYFGGNIPGSKRYKELMAAAVAAFAGGLQQQAAAAASGGATSGGGGSGGGEGGGLAAALARRDPRRRFAERVMAEVAAASAAGADGEGDGGSEAGTQGGGGLGSGTDVAEDDDSWLDQMHEKLQRELDRRQAEVEQHGARRGAAGAGGAPAGEGTAAAGEQAEGGAAAEASADGRKEAAEPPEAMEVDPDAIAAKMRTFMEHLSGLEGAELPEGGDDGASAAGEGPAAAAAATTSGGKQPHRGKGGRTGQGGRGEAGGGGGGGLGVDFDAAGFLKELEKVLGLAEKAAGEGGRGGTEWRAPAGATGVGPGAGWDPAEDDEEGESSSGDEGSSFFSDEEEEEEGEEGEEGEGSDGEELGAGQRAGGGGAGAAVTAGASAAAPDGMAARPLGAPSPAQRPAATAAAAAAAAAPAAPRAADAKQPPALALRRGFLAPRRPTATVPTITNRASPGATASASPAASQAAAAAMPAPAGTSGKAGTPGAAAEPKAGGRGGPALGRLGAGAGQDRSGPGRGASWQQQERWEAHTATDSDDEGRDGGGDDDERSSGASGSGDEREEGREGGSGDPTEALLAALGLEDEANGGRGAWEKGKEAARAATRAAAAVDRGGARRRRGATGGGGGAGGQAADPFMQMYDSAMAAELLDTTLAASFDRVGPPHANTHPNTHAPAPGAGGGGGEGRPAGAAGAAGAGAGGLQPVDLDMNLVRNLLRSYTAQGAAAGPAGNLAGVLGLDLVAGDVE